MRLPPRPTPASSAPLTSSATPLPPAPPGLRRSSRLAGTADLSKQPIHETGLSVAVTGGDGTLCSSLPLDTEYYTTEYDARRIGPCLHTAEPEMVVQSSMAEWFDKTVTMLFTDQLRCTPEIYQHYTDRHLYHTESIIPNSSQLDGIGMSRVSDSYGSGYNFDDGVLDAMSIQWMNIKDLDSIVLVTEDGLTHEMESHKLADLKKVPREQHPYMIVAASKEIGDLIRIGTFATEPSIPSDRKAIDSRIVFKVKYRANGEFDKYKARLVAKGYLQRLGFDFFSAFSPMATLSSGRSEWTGLLLVLYIAKHVRGDLVVRLGNLQVATAFTDGPWRFRRNWLRRNDRGLVSLAWRLANGRQMAGLGSTTAIHQLGHPEKRKRPEQFGTYEVYNSKVSALTHQLSNMMALYVSFRRALRGHTTAWYHRNPRLKKRRSR